MKYSEKLKDPRWQKKRLEVLERDEWHCQCCGDGESTLHVHHLYYEKGKEPWDYPAEAFLTLCEACHEEEHASRTTVEQGLLSTLRKNGFLSGDLINIATGFNYLIITYPPEVVSCIIQYALSTKSVMKQISDQYFQSLEKKHG